VLSTQLHGASIGYKEGRMLGSLIEEFILIEGRIEKGDKDKLLKELRLWSSNRQLDTYRMPKIQITSKGGDFEEAMKMGLLIRRSLVQVRSTDQCYSACAIILFSAVDRSPLDVGIHRPYYNKEYFSSLTMVKANEKYTSLVSKTKSFLLEMNVPTNIVDKMFETPSDEIYILNTNEWKQIAGKSPAFEEWVKSQCVDLTDAEYNDKVRSMGSMGKGKRKSNLPQGYVDYLWGKHTEYVTCKDTISFREFSETIKAWR